MTQEKRATTSQGLFGLTGKNIALLSLLVVFLIGGFSFAFLRVQCRRGNANFLCSAATPEVAATPTAASPTVEPTAEVAVAQVTDEPATETATSLPPTPTEEPPTSTATTVPPTLTTTPTLTPSAVPSATPTATATDTTTPPSSAEPTAEPTQEPTAEATQEVTTEPTQEATTEPTAEAASLPTATPTPQPATIIYVQGGGLPSSMGIVSSTGEVINDNLHGYAAAPAWSPDGRKIAFFGEPGIGQLGPAYGLGEGIWTIDYPGGGNPTQLFVTNDVKNLAWSPNGKWLAFEYGPPGKSHETIVVDAASRQKVFNFPGEQPAWSSSSEAVVIKTCEPSCGLWQVSLKDLSKLQLTSKENDSFPALSLDGQYLSFASKEGENWEVYLLRLADRNLVRLTNRAEVADIAPVFSRHGQEIYFLSGASANWQIMALALDGSNEHLIKSNVGVGGEWGLARPAIH